MDLQQRRWQATVCVALTIVTQPAAWASTDAEVPEAAEACLSCHAIQPGEPELEGPQGPILADDAGQVGQFLRRIETKQFGIATLPEFVDCEFPEHGMFSPVRGPGRVFTRVLPSVYPRG